MYKAFKVPCIFSFLNFQSLDYGQQFASLLTDFGCSGGGPLCPKARIVSFPLNNGWL